MTIFHTGREVFADKRYTTSRGLSIVETLVAVAAGTLVIIGVASLVLSLYRTNAYAVEQAFAINSARRGIERMVRDIREATYSDEGAFPIIEADPYALYFYSDVDRDDNVERIKFYIQNGTLMRDETKASGTPPVYPSNPDSTSAVSDHVRNTFLGESLFRYYDTSGNEVTDLSNVTDIAFVVVRLIVDINPHRLPNNFILQSSASLRNLSRQ